MTRPSQRTTPEQQQLARASRTGYISWQQMLCAGWMVWLVLVLVPCFGSQFVLPGTPDLLFWPAVAAT
jgi:hypothetical protein